MKYLLISFILDGTLYITPHSDFIYDYRVHEPDPEYSEPVIRTHPKGILVLPKSQLKVF